MATGVMVQPALGKQGRGLEKRRYARKGDEIGKNTGCGLFGGGMEWLGLHLPEKMTVSLTVVDRLLCKRMRYDLKKLA